MGILKWYEALFMALVCEGVFCVNFVPLAYKIKLYCGDEAIVKSFYNNDIVILICCSTSQFTHS